MIWLVIETPDGRHVRQQWGSIEGANALLQTGYRVVGQVHLADAKGEGGFVAPLDGPTAMTALLDAHGDELVNWLAARGFIRNDP